MNALDRGAADRDTQIWLLGDRGSQLEDDT
jgi:hypothetical protein